MTAPPPVQQYNLTAPSEEDALRSLARLLGSDTATRVWHTACAAAGIRRPGPTLTLDQLSAAAQQLRQQPGVTSVVASSLVVRLNSYRLLSRNAA